jgi:hypothetical protein
MRRLLPLLAVPLLLSGCLRYYTGYPKDKLERPPAQRPGVFQYRIKPYPTVMDSGRRGLEDALQKKSPFRDAKRVEEVPAQGPFVDVEVRWRQPGIFSVLFIYVSAVTYTIVPQWSTKEKFTLVFDVYRDGQEKRRFEYEVGRKGFTWLPLVLATWYTATSPDQAEVFESVVFKFYDEAAPLLADEPSSRSP